MVLSLKLFQSTHPQRVWRASRVSSNGAFMFQSTHPRRVWLIYTLYINTIYLCFNPHTHEGCDILLLEDTERKAVSIHTPTKGVTSRSSTVHPKALFQSTHPRRVWRYSCLVVVGADGVSIHTPTKGVTHIAAQVSVHGIVSIHTPTKGVTPNTQSVRTSYLSFNPHTHEGCDFVLFLLQLITPGFNPHTHEGCDLSLP